MIGQRRQQHDAVGAEMFPRRNVSGFFCGEA